MKQSVDIGYEHRDEHERHYSLDGFEPTPRPTPKDAELGEEKTREPHRGTADIHRQEAGGYGDSQGTDRVDAPSYLPKHHKIDGKMEDVDVKKAVEKMILQRTAQIKAYVPEDGGETEGGDRELNAYTTTCS